MYRSKPQPVACFRRSCAHLAPHPSHGLVAQKSSYKKSSKITYPSTAMRYRRPHHRRRETYSRSQTQSYSSAQQMLQPQQIRNLWHNSTSNDSQSSQSSSSPSMDFLPNSICPVDQNGPIPVTTNTTISSSISQPPLQRSLPVVKKITTKSALLLSEMALINDSLTALRSIKPVSVSASTSSHPVSTQQPPSSQLSR